MARATWFCIDIECSGPVPALYDMLSLGVVAVKERQDGDFTLGEPFYLELRPTGAGVDLGAMAVNGLDLESLSASGLRLPKALEALTDFVERELLEGTQPVFVGHNAPFDWSFVSYSYAACATKRSTPRRWLPECSACIGLIATRSTWRRSSRCQKSSHTKCIGQIMMRGIRRIF